MNLAPQTRLGPYEVLDLLGAGGMGEVYRARDTRLDREVAIKVLPPQLAADGDFAQRFEREARLLGSLSHPNITVVHDVGQASGLRFLVTELLEGETLAERLAGGSLSLRKVVELAVQVAQGLAAAHAQGVVHRDLKPANVFLTRDGRVKLLDFGLARDLGGPGRIPLAGSDPDVTPTCDLEMAELHTRTGLVMGTVAYMSPEQVRGLELDHRSDIFSFGILLYEMLSGRRPFHGDSSVETMNAILKEEPPDLALPHGRTAPALERIVRHCLEKRPEARFQSARDLAFDLEALQALSGSEPVPRLRPRLPRWTLLAAIAGLALLVGLGFAMGRAFRRETPPRFTQQTFRQGMIASARFTDGGQNLVFSARWAGERGTEIYTARVGSPEFRALGAGEAHVLAVSPKGDAAVLTRTWMNGGAELGTLGILSLGGGARRDLADSVADADWSLDGAQLAVSRYGEGRFRIEYPLGKVRLQAEGEAWYSHVRLHPAGRLLAFLHHPLRLDDRGVVSLLDLDTGAVRALGPEWSTARGLVWSPDGKALWVSAREWGISRALYEVTLSGRHRELLQVPGGCQVADVAPDGRVLIIHERIQASVWVQGERDPRPRDLSWLNYSMLQEISPDGSTLVIQEGGASSGPDYEVYLQPTSGEPALKVGNAQRPALSPDKRWILGARSRPTRHLALLPTGPGEARSLAFTGLHPLALWRWCPDGTRFLVAMPGEKGSQVFLQGLEDRTFTPLAVPEGWRATFWLSPDGTRQVLARPAPDGSGFERALWNPGEPAPEPRPLLGIERSEYVMGWDATGTHLFAGRRHPEGLDIYRVEPERGGRDLWRQVRAGGPLDPTTCRLAQDGKTLAFSSETVTSEVFVVEGLR